MNGWLAVLAGLGLTATAVGWAIRCTAPSPRRAQAGPAPGRRRLGGPGQRRRRYADRTGSPTTFQPGGPV